jgi:RNA polymerase sigma factor (TIGR02999 family)
MPSAPAPDVTHLLLAWRDGDNAALERLAPLVYGELRKLAHSRLRAESPNAPIDTTDLVHEAYLRLVDARSVSWQDRTHFYALCARAMRRILVDAARRRRSLKRGGAILMVPLENSLAISSDRDSDLLSLDEALTDLTAADARQGQVVELRYFGGLSVDETARALGISPHTVVRDWNMAKLWLLRALRGPAAPRPQEA